MSAPDADLRAMTEPDDPGLRELRAAWTRRPGIVGWLGETEHKAIALRVIATAFGFFLLAGLEAVAMRVQLARPGSRLIGPDLYNQLFTTHGSTMMFLFAVPVMQGMGLYLVPLMVGARNVAFPRLNAYAYYLFLIGGLLLYFSFATNAAPDAGWFAYTPLSGPQFSPGKRVDVWAQMITFTELSSLCMAVNTIVTVFKHRAPGMAVSRMPVFVWSMLVTSFMVVFAMPSVMLGSTMLALDRLVGTHFFNHAEGGDSLLWQHLFWFFAHPEVYIIFLPATGIVSTVLAAFARRPLFGYVPVVLSLVATAFIGFGLWVHHMFATPLPQIGQSFFTAASILIAIPSGAQMFCWIATLATGRPRTSVPLAFASGFIALFLVGGLTGVMLASVPLNRQVHDTFFVVAHLHYVLIGGAVFPLFGGFHYWFPKATGRMLSERLGWITFWLMFVGFNAAFFPMHLLGLHGMPRRVYTYAGATGWGPLNLLATAGAAVLGLGVLAFVINVARSLRSGPKAPPDPWRADTLEWSTASPPPPYNFALPPTVAGRSALWEAAPDQAVVTGLCTDRREVLVTTLLDALPDHRTELPAHAIAPFFFALATGVGIIVSIFTPWGLPLGMALAAPPLVKWFWPPGDRKREPAPEQP